MMYWVDGSVRAMLVLVIWRSGAIVVSTVIPIGNFLRQCMDGTKFNTLIDCIFFLFIAIDSKERPKIILQN